MSKTWAQGSTRGWRRHRLTILVRDNYRCRIQLDGCTTYATHVHHTLGRAITGDDPAHEIAACAHCNLKVGDPTKQPDPPGTSSTRW